MNTWELYPSKGTHYDWMRSKAKLHTFEYTCYYGRDRDDWSEGTIQAFTTEDAIMMLERRMLNEGFTLKRSSVKPVQS
jgi:hypothetical protein